MCDKYAAALVRPFDPNAEGAQVCDEYCFPTATAKLTRTFTLSTLSGQSNIDFVLQPNPICTLASQEQYVSGTTWNDQITGGIYWTRTAVTGAIGGGGSNGFSEQGMCTQATLGNTFTRYRVVGFGTRLESIMPATQQQGSVFMSKIPSLATWGNYAGSSPSTTNPGYWAEYLAFYGLPPVDSTGFVSTQMLQLPTSCQYSVPDMSVHTGIETVGTKCSPKALEFRDGNFVDILTAQGGGRGQGLAVFGTTAGTAAIGSNLVDEDYQMQGGWSTLVFRATGLPAASQCFTLEVVFHLEGEPNLATSVIANATMPPVHVAAMHAIHTMASRRPHFTSILKDVVRGVRKVGRTIDSIAGAGTSQRLINGAMTAGLGMFV